MIGTRLRGTQHSELVFELEPGDVAFLKSCGTAPVASHNPRGWLIERQPRKLDAVVDVILTELND